MPEAFSPPQAATKSDSTRIGKGRKDKSQKWEDRKLHAAGFDSPECYRLWLRLDPDRRHGPSRNSHRCDRRSRRLGSGSLVNPSGPGASLARNLQRCSDSSDPLRRTGWRRFRNTRCRWLLMSTQSSVSQNREPTALATWGALQRQTRRPRRTIHRRRSQVGAVLRFTRLRLLGRGEYLPLVRVRRLLN